MEKNNFLNKACGVDHSLSLFHLKIAITKFPAEYKQATFILFEKDVLISGSGTHRLII